MSKGKKTDKETIYKVMVSMFSTNNYSETARQLDMPQKTVENIYKKNIEKEEFAKLYELKKEEFTKNATRIINKATNLLEKRIDTALNNQDELEEIINQTCELDGYTKYQKKMIINKIAKMQLNNLSEITTAIGTLYDKRNLAEGKSINNTDLNVNIKVVE